MLTDLDHAIHVKDIVLDPEIAVLADPEQLVVKVSEVAVRAEEEAVAAVAAEAEAAGEVAGEGEEKPAAEAPTEKD